MEEKKYDLLTLGEVLLRLSAPGNERNVTSSTFDKKIGGAELNVACAVAQLGLKTGMVTTLPSHSIGEYARRQILANRVDTTYVIADHKKNARVGIYYFEYGANPRKPQVVYDRLGTTAREMTLSDFPVDMYAQTRCFHTSGITLALNEQCRSTAIEMMKRFKEEGALISLDVNFRMNLWTGEEARACIEELLPYVDIFFCSEDTARLTFKKQGTLEGIMKSFAEEYKINVVAATKRIVQSPKIHDFGSLVYDMREDVFYEEKAYEGIEVVDRVGSGDAYVAGALFGLLKDNGCSRDAMRYGNASGALKNTVPGDIAVMTKEELDDLIEDHNNTGYHSEMKR